MPKYAYICGVCKSIFEVIHPYRDKVTKCQICESEESVSKYLGNPTNIRNKPEHKKSKTGDVVLETIEEIKKEIKTEKENKRRVRQ